MGSKTQRGRERERETGERKTKRKRHTGQQEREREGERGRERWGWGVFDAWTAGLFSTVCRPRFRADVLTVSGSMEGEIPTKGGVQILWEILPLFNISWRPTIYSWDSIPLEGPTFRLTPQAQWAALNWVPAHSLAPWQIVPHESPCLFILLFFPLRVAKEKGGMPYWWCMWEGEISKGVVWGGEGGGCLWIKYDNRARGVGSAQRGGG